MEQNKEPFAAENTSYVEAVTNMLLDYYKNNVTYDSVFAAVSDAQDAVEEFTSYAATHTIPECVYYLSDHYDDKLPLSSIIANTTVTTATATDNTSSSVTYYYWPATYWPNTPWPTTPCDPVYPGPTTPCDPVYPSPTIPYTPPSVYPYVCQCSGCLAYGTNACPRTNSTPNIVYTGCGPQKEEKDNKDNKNKSKSNNNNTKSKNDRSASAPAVETPSNRGKIDQFKRIASALSAQYARKNEAYGDSFGKSVKRYGVISALTRMSDKWNRLESLLIDKNNNRVSDESVDDTLLDLATYCIMTVLATRSNDEIDKIVKNLEGK